MADLRQNADAVADLSGRVLAGAVFQLLHDMKRIVQNLIVLVAVDVDDGADSAGVMFLLQALVHPA